MYVVKFLIVCLINLVIKLVKGLNIVDINVKNVYDVFIFVLGKFVGIIIKCFKIINIVVFILIVIIVLIEIFCFFIFIIFYIKNLLYWWCFR